VKKAVKDRIDIQFPSTVPKLGTGLADVKMAHLQEIICQPLTLLGAFFECKGGGKRPRVAEGQVGQRKGLRWPSYDLPRLAY
jgi:hypothetical protein